VAGRLLNFTYSALNDSSARITKFHQPLSHEQLCQPYVHLKYNKYIKKNTLAVNKLGWLNFHGSEHTHDWWKKIDEKNDFQTTHPQNKNIAG
jgi:hypothetical protein